MSAAMPSRAFGRPLAGGRVGTALAVLALAVAYYAAARLGLLLAFPGSNASPVWPPSGIALAVVVLFGARLLPGVALGALAANAAVFAANNAAGLPALLEASVAIAVGNTLETAVAAFALRRWVGARSPFDRLADVAKFIVIALLTCAIAATVGTSALLGTGIVPWVAAPTILLTWWTGDVTGMLVVAPLLMTTLHGSASGFAPRWRPALEALALAAAIALLGVLVFAHPTFAQAADRRLAWLFLPCIAWAAFRHGARGVAGASLLICGLAVWGTTRGLGPFASGHLNDALTVLQTFVALCAGTGLVLAADRRERLLLGRGRTLARDLALPWLVLLGCTAIAIAGWHVVASDIDRRAQDRFSYLVDMIRTRIDERMLGYEQLLRSGAALFAASQTVEREEWQAFVAGLQTTDRYPGILAMAFLPRVTAAERDAHVRTVRSQGFGAYDVRPAGEREQYTPIMYIEPFNEVNRRAFGFDTSTEPVRRAAMTLARDTGEAALTGKVALQQEQGSDAQPGVVLYLPLYRHGAPLATPEQRQAASIGYVSGVFRISDLMAGLLGSDLAAVRLRLYDGEAADTRAQLYDSLRSGAGVSSPFSTQEALAMPNRRWTLGVEALPAFEADVDRQKAQIVLIAGIGISLLLFALVRSLGMTGDRAALLARDMTVAVRESEAKFRSLAESAGESIVIADGEGRVLSFNRAAEQLFGHAEAGMIGRELALLLPPDARDAHLERMQDMQGEMQRGPTGRVIRSVLLRGLAKDGHEFPMELSLATWQTDGGRFCSAIMRDITERERNAQALIASERAATHELALRVQADAELAAKNEALTRSNTELAQFAYVASHDLQEPLRTVASYSQLLLRRHRPKLDGEAVEFLDFIGHAARRAQTLINDLLSLARLDSNARPAAPVAMQQVFDETRKLLELSLRENGVTLTADPLPVVTGDRGQLLQLLQNLIGNAVKFRGEAPPYIHVGVRREEPAWRFSVSDNGIGIDPRFHDRIFTLFQRLHREDYPGTGIGLAICKKVVERHGGQIGVESTPGRGSTFFFTIPADRPSPTGGD